MYCNWSFVEWIWEKHKCIVVPNPTKIHFLGIQKWRQNLTFLGIGIRDILKGSKKYTFGKSIFKTFFKNRNSEILPPFLSTSNSWMSSGLLQKDTIICRGEWIGNFVGTPKTSHGPEGPTWKNRSLNPLQKNYYKWYVVR